MPEIISTENLASANQYLDELVAKLREVNAAGVTLDVENLTIMMMLGERITADTLDESFRQLALILAVALQRLAQP